MAENIKNALTELLDAITDTGVFVDLEADCEGDGPVIQAYQALDLPVPDDIQDWLVQE